MNLLLLQFVDNEMQIEISILVCCHHLIWCICTKKLKWVNDKKSFGWVLSYQNREMFLLMLFKLCRLRYTALSPYAMAKYCQCFLVRASHLVNKHKLYVQIGRPSFIKFKMVVFIDIAQSLPILTKTKFIKYFVIKFSCQTFK